MNTATIDQQHATPHMPDEHTRRVAEVVVRLNAAACVLNPGTKMGLLAPAKPPGAGVLARSVKHAATKDVSHN